MRLVMATTNAHKRAEAQAILAPLGIEVLAPPRPLPEVDEDAPTFAGNAAKKARSGAAALGLPVLADDSGLVVDALGGEPGVRSARYAGEGAGDEANNALLVQRLAALGVVDPPARFVCCVALALPDGTLLAQAEGHVEGVVRWPGRGAHGFGYDPLFHHPPSGCRLAEMEPGAKNALSHRGAALRALAAILRERGPASAGR
ncbi:MAG: non-canonical purine NTP pyrophosphatase [Planctomycetia bacterium]